MSSEVDYIKRKPSGFFVTISILATIALLAAMLALLFYRSMTQRAPAKVVIVQGDERWKGTIVSVEGPALPVPLHGVLDKNNKYVVSFFLDPGVYLFDAKLNGKSPFDAPLHLELSDSMDNVGMDLANSRLTPPEGPPTTRPTLLPGT